MLRGENAPGEVKGFGRQVNYPKSGVAYEMCLAAAAMAGARFKLRANVPPPNELMEEMFVCLRGPEGGSSFKPPQF